MEMQNNKLEELINTQNKLLQQMIVQSAKDTVFAEPLKNAEMQIFCILNQLGTAAQTQLDNSLMKQKTELEKVKNESLKALEEKFQAEIKEIHIQSIEERENAYAQGYNKASDEKKQEMEQLRISLNREKEIELSDLKAGYEEEKRKLIEDFDTEKRQLRSSIEKELSVDYDKRMNEQLSALQQKNDKEMAEKLKEQESKLTQKFEIEKNNEIERLSENHKQENDELNKKLSVANNELKTYQGRNGELVDRFDVITQDYGKVLDQIFKCRSMEAYLKRTKLQPKENGAEAIIHFIKIVGNNFTMARDIRDAMQRYRKTGDTCPLTEDELKLIDIVNEFYRKEHNRDDENDKVLFLPDNCNDPASAVRFNSSQMQDFDHPAETKFKSIRCIYAPCFRQFDENRIEKAIVNASEDPV